MTERVVYHTRHIPLELLNLDTPMGKDVVRNGLCDILEPKMLARLAALRVELVETRLVWWELEPREGVLDFSRLERDLDKIEKAGMKAGVFPWFQHPPVWYDPKGERHVRFRCLEHDESSTILSLWDPRTLEVYDRLYGELARRMGDRLSFLYAGISGDYGEVCYPFGVSHYLFSSPHRHAGFWCGDVLARQSFAQQMEARYGNLAQLNAAWSTAFRSWQDDLMPPLPVERNGAARHYDFARWYTNALLNFTDAACGVVRRYFPNTRIGLPLGSSDEALIVGQIKSQAVKVAAKHKMVARWTGMAYLKRFDRSNVLDRRFSSAARFYGAPFAMEASLILTKESAADGLYESAANGTVIIHDDSRNMLRAEEIHARLRPKLFFSQPQCKIAILYPLLDELLNIAGFDFKSFMDAAADLRSRFDYDLCDYIMIQDGFLEGMKDLLVIVPVYIPCQTIATIEAFVRQGGRVWMCGNSMLGVLRDNGQMEDCLLNEIRIENAINPPPKSGVYRVAQAPAFEPYRRLIEQYGPGYYTVHEDCISRYLRDKSEIEVLPKLPD